jgi:hypothetical protein
MDDCNVRDVADMLKHNQVQTVDDVLRLLNPESKQRCSFSATKLNKIRELSLNGGTEAERQQAKKILKRKLEL